MPQWYRIITAARYLGVPPWDLMNRSSAWVDIAVVASNAEAHAHEMKTKRVRSAG